MCFSSVRRRADSERLGVKAFSVIKSYILVGPSCSSLADATLSAGAHAESSFADAMLDLSGGGGCAVQFASLLC